MAEVDQKRKQMEYIMIVALVIVAFFIGLSRFKKEKKDDEVFSRKEFNEKWKEVEVLEREVPRRERPISYNVDIKKIPFRSPFEKDQEAEPSASAGGEDIALPAMTLQGMVWNSVRPQAIINSMVYDIGDTLAGIGREEDGDTVKVKDITKDGIYLRYMMKDFIVRPR